MDSATLISAIGALFVVAIGFVLFGGQSNKADARARELATKLDGGSPKKGLFDFMKSDDVGNRRKQIEASLLEIEEKQKNQKKKQNSLKSKLIQADWSVSPQTFNMVSIMIGIAVGALVFLIAQKPLFALAAIAVAGFGLPRWFLGMVIARRQKKFEGSFADAVDVIVRGVRTGLPLSDCLKIIAHESPEPVKSEFLRMVEAESVGVPIETCLKQMYDRVPIPEVKFFIIVLNIQRSTGGNLGESLANLSGVLRGRKLLREKVKALSAEAKMSAIIIGCLPIAVGALVSVMSPDYMTELYTTPTGHRNLMIAAGMMVTGTLVMRKMINFKI